MSRKHVLLVALTLALASSLSALVAYRLALRRSVAPFGSGSGPSEGAKGGCVDFHDAASHTGETACVSGRVLRVFNSNAGNAFIDFCADYRKCPFGTVIFSADRAKFGDLATLEGRMVEIRGEIRDYQGRAEIIIHDPQQIRVILRP